MIDRPKPDIIRLRHDKNRLPDRSQLIADMQQNSMYKNGKAWSRSTDGQVNYFSEEYDYEYVSFARLESWNSVRTRMEQMKMTPETRIVGLDIMGQGTPCADLGCDYTLALTLPIPDYPMTEQEMEHKGLQGIEVINGDIFNKETTAEYMQKLDTILSIEDNKLGLVFFRPWGGISGYIYNEYALRYLVQHYLYPLYNRLHTNGVMFIELHAVPDVLFTQLVTSLKSKGVWVDYIHTKNKSVEDESGTKLLRIEKPMVSTHRLP